MDAILKNKIENAFQSDGRKHSYSGVDISAVMIFPDPYQDDPRKSSRRETPGIITDRYFPGLKTSETIKSLHKRVYHSNIKTFAELQTISVTSAVSMYPVRNLGQRKVKAIKTSARTFAGTIIFSTFDRDVLYEIFDTYDIHTTTDQFYLDMLPPFDVVIQATNEYGDSSIRVITGIHLTHDGTAYSVDDMFLETSHTYVAEHVTPFMQLADISSEILKKPYIDMIRPELNVRSPLTQTDVDRIRNSIIRNSKTRINSGNTFLEPIFNIVYAGLGAL